MSTEYKYGSRREQIEAEEWLRAHEADLPSMDAGMSVNNHNLILAPNFAEDGELSDYPGTIVLDNLSKADYDTASANPPIRLSRQDRLIQRDLSVIEMLHKGKSRKEVCETFGITRAHLRVIVHRASRSNNLLVST